MNLLNQLVSERDEISSTQTGLVERAADEARDLTESEDTNLKDLKTRADVLDVRIAELREIQVANLEAAKLRAEVSATDDAPEERAAGRVTITDEPLTYGEHSGRSFFSDLYRSQVHHEPASQARMARHSAEMDIEQRAAGTTSNYAGLVVPQYLTQLAAELARAGRPFANLCTPMPLGSSGMTLNISRVTTGSSAAVQVENAEISDTTIDDTLLTVDIRTVAAGQQISRQALERGEGIDALIMADLESAIATTLDEGCIYGDGTSGALLGLNNITGKNAITYTDGSPTVAEFYPKLMDAIQQINSNRYAGPDLIIMHPRRAAWLAAAVDGQNRPLVLPQTNVPSNAMGTGPVAGYGLNGLQLAGIPVVADANISTTGGASNTEDSVFVVRRADMLLFESPGAPSMVRMDQTLGGQLTVKLVAYQYAAAVFGRYPAAISKVSGTGLVAPSF